jgi:DinB superfamily
MLEVVIAPKTTGRNTAPLSTEVERCEQCGFVWDLVPYSEVPARLGDSVAALRRLVLPPDRPIGWAARTATRPTIDTWSPIEYVCHIRDVLLVQRDRVFTILVEDNPTFGPMYREQRVTLAGYGDEDLGDAVAQLEMAGHLLARTLGRLDKGQFQRTGVYGYPTVATRSLEWVAAQTLHEVLHHTLDIAAQLAPAESGIEHVRRSPTDLGTLELIVARPSIDARTVFDEAVLDVAVGLVGDSWVDRPSRKMSNLSAHPEMQLNVMNARAAALVCGSPDRWSLAGDQLFVDLDLSSLSLPAGTRLSVGDAEIEITAVPHRGCAKFAERFGRDALRLVNSAVGRELNLRGINAKVVRGGTIRRGDVVRRVI